MKARLLAALAATVLMSTGQALADPPNDATYAGGCGSSPFVSDATSATTNGRLGVIYGAVSASSMTPAHNPVRVDTMICEVTVNGTTWASIPAAGTYGSAVLAPTPVYVDADESDVIEVCTTVRTTDFHGQQQTFQRTCEQVVDVLVPPQEFADLIDAALATLDGVVCPVLAGVSPIVVGGLFAIQSDGDVWLNGARVKDCPPYAP